MGTEDVWGLVEGTSIDFLKREGIRRKVRENGQRDRKRTIEKEEVHITQDGTY